MTISTKDKIALLVAIVAGSGAGYLTTLAGYGWLLVAAPYAILVIPSIVVYVADQKKLMAWQVCVLSYALYVLLENMRMGGLGMQGAISVIYIYWALGTAASSPVAIFYYLKRARNPKSIRLELFLVGLLFLVVVSSLFLDLFVVAEVGMGWVICWFVESLRHRRHARDQASKQFALLVGSALFIAGLSSILFFLFFKQKAFAYAANIGDARTAVALARIGADPNELDSNGDSSLRAATWNGDLAMVQALLSTGAKVDLEAYPEERPGFVVITPSGTALGVAAAVGRTEICQSLLSAGADPNKKNRQGRTPWLMALGAYGSIQCIPLLLDHSADANARDSMGRTPLMLLAAYDDHDPRVQSAAVQMLARGADPAAKDNNGQAAWDWATLNHRVLLANLLRTAGAH